MFRERGANTPPYSAEMCTTEATEPLLSQEWRLQEVLGFSPGSWSMIVTTTIASVYLLSRYFVLRTIHRLFHKSRQQPRK